MSGLSTSISWDSRCSFKGACGWEGVQEAAFATVKEYLSLFLLKNILTKAVFYSACHYAKSFSLEDNSCSQKKDLRRVPRV